MLCSRMSIRLSFTIPIVVVLCIQGQPLPSLPPLWPGLDASVERLVCGVKTKVWRALQLPSEPRLRVSRQPMLPPRGSQARQRSGTDHRISNVVP
jgi:hypothetical protein